jgi:hypothetical protein
MMGPNGRLKSFWEQPANRDAQQLLPAWVSRLAMDQPPEDDAAVADESSRQGNGNLTVSASCSRQCESIRQGYGTRASTSLTRTTNPERAGVDR